MFAICLVCKYYLLTLTIGSCCFVECLGHLAKSIRQRTCRQRFLCQVPHIGHSIKPLPSAKSALGKKNPPPVFAECPICGTRQRFYIFLKKFFAECQGFALGEEHFLQKNSMPSARVLQSWELGSLLRALPSAMVVALDKEVMALGKGLFVECQTWQSWEFFLFFSFQQLKLIITYISSRTTTTQDISHTHPSSIIHHIHIYCT